MFEDDPEFGKFIAHYPSNRLRLLLTGGAVLAVVWFVTTVALWQVEAGIAAVITVIIIALATLAVGWYMAHLWNREVVLYQRGFSYREGSQLAFRKYAEVASLRQKAERLAYFGGLVRRTVYRSTLKTVYDETITLGNVYRRMDELSLRLEQLIMQTLKPALERKLAQGERVAFGDLAVSPAGLFYTPPASSTYSSEAESHLPWGQYAGHRVERGQLALLQKPEGIWQTVALDSTDNLRVLLDVLKSNE